MTVDVFFRASCRTIAVDAWDARQRRRNWGITYFDPKTLRADPEVRRKRQLLDPFRAAFA